MGWCRPSTRRMLSSSPAVKLTTRVIVTPTLITVGSNLLPIRPDRPSQQRPSVLSQTSSCERQRKVQIKGQLYSSRSVRPAGPGCGGTVAVAAHVGVVVHAAQAPIVVPVLERLRWQAPVAPVVVEVASAVHKLPPQPRLLAWTKANALRSHVMYKAS